MLLSLILGIAGSTIGLIVGTVGALVAAAVLRYIGFPKWMTTTALIVAAGWFTAGFIDGNATRRCEAKVAAEVAKIEARLAAEQRALEEHQRVIVAELIARNAQLEREGAEDDEAADRGPDAGACGLGLDGVQRLQRLGPR